MTGFWFVLNIFIMCPLIIFARLHALHACCADLKKVITSLFSKVESRYLFTTILKPFICREIGEKSTDTGKTCVYRIYRDYFVCISVYLFSLLCCRLCAQWILLARGEVMEKTESVSNRYPSLLGNCLK